MTQHIKAYIVAAFVKNDAGGSPTGVVLNAAGLTSGQMQFIARQLGVSHTAFVFEPTGQSENVIIRFFTPQGEILNCGHGTIAAHYTSTKHFNFTGNKILFQQAKEGIQQVEIVQHDNQIEIFLQQNPIHFSPVNHKVANNLLDALSVKQSDLATNFPITIASPGSQRFLIGISPPELLNKIAPDFDKLSLVCKDNKCMGAFVYFISSLAPQAVAVARMFAPNIGVNEDIINGNSSSCLGEYLLRLNKQHNIDLLVHQGHTFNRDGTVSVKVKKVEDNFETKIGGTAKIETEIVLSLEGIP